LKLNLLEEYTALETREKNAQTSPYDKARYFIYKGLVGMILFDPVRGDLKDHMSQSDTDLWNTFRADIKKGYDIMHQNHPSRMWDTSDLLWCFIPRTFWRDIEFICGVD
jgi:hypothetical protein